MSDNLDNQEYCNEDIILTIKEWKVLFAPSKIWFAGYANGVDFCFLVYE